MQADGQDKVCGNWCVCNVLYMLEFGGTGLSDVFMCFVCVSDVFYVCVWCVVGEGAVWTVHCIRSEQVQLHAVSLWHYLQLFIYLFI